MHQAPYQGCQCCLQAYAAEAAHLGPPSLPRLSAEQLHGELQAGMPIKEESSQTQRAKRQRVSA